MSAQSPSSTGKTQSNNLVLTILASEESDQRLLKSQENALARLVGLNSVDIMPMTSDDVDTYGADKSSFDLLSPKLLIVIKPSTVAGVPN